MNSQSRLLSFLQTPFTFWMIVLFVGSYFIFSLDDKKIREIAPNASFFDTVSGYYNALKLSKIKKGIDLEGGTYLVLSVDVEKAIENRLQAENKSLRELLKAKKVSPSKKSIEKQALILTFEREEDAAVGLSLLREQRGQVLKSSLSGAVVTAKLFPEIEQSLRVNAVEQAVNVLSNRLSGYGVESIVVQQHGERQIVVQLPGIDDPEHVKSVITKTAHLEFKLIEDVASSQDALLDRYDGDLPSDKLILPGKKGSDEGGLWYLVSAYPDITGDHIVNAEVARDEFGKPTVSFKLDAQGAREFAELTGRNINRRLGIIIDDIVYQAPNIASEITGGSASITGQSGLKECFDLSVVLRSGSLAAPLKFEHENRVGASLGQDSIYRGILSCVVALLLIFFFSLFYYKIPGLFAIFALIYNLFLIMLFLSYFGATLTLPGIAGMVLTIGMAIDASILIYETIKEELARGQALRTAIKNGFNGVFVVILDSNITTFLTGFVLYIFGGPAIKGFAVTIMAGIVATMLAGVWFLRSLFTLALDVFSARDIKF